MSKRILIVEDDEDILNLLKDVLEKESFEVTGLSGLNHTESIIKIIGRQKAELVILDFLLPGRNGGELCHEIKRGPSTAEVPVIMLSAFPRVIKSLGNYGADAFIAKPFEIQELLDTIHNCFDNNLTAIANS